MDMSQNKAFSRKFNKELIRLVLPIMIQNLISAVVVTVDIIMLGFINQDAMSAVSIGGQIIFFLTLFYMGLSTGLGTLVAQYWGKRDMENINRITGIAIRYAFIISVAFFVISFLQPALVMRLFTNVPELINYGSIYLRPVSFTFIMMSLSYMYMSVMKSTENTHISAWISSTSLILNVLLDALVVFVLYPNQSGKAVWGVALATLFAKLLELVWILICALKKGYRFPSFSSDSTERLLRKDFIKYTMPILGNYLVWGGAITVTATIIGRLSSDLVAANAIVSVIRNLSVVMSSGIAAGGAVLIGKYLGQNRFDWAKEAGKRVYWYAMYFGIVACGFILVIRPMVYQVVNLREGAQEYLDWMLYVSAFYVIGKAVNAAIIGGVLTAGGDSKFGFICDSVVMWLVVLPLSFLAAFVWKLDHIWVYVIINLDEMIKIPLGALRFRRYKWLNNMTRELIEE